MRLPKKLLLFALCLLITVSLSGNWVDIYKKGKIELKPDPAFGKNTKWDELFFRMFHSFVVAPDGSIFISDNRKHKIHKFNIKGELVKTFGQKGQGPGDFCHPTCDYIYKGTLLISEYPTTRRFSFFDLNCNFIKIVRTKQQCYGIIPIDSEHLLYNYNHLPRSKNRSTRSISTVISKLIKKNLKTGKESLIHSYEFTYKTVPCGKNGTLSGGPRNNVIYRLTTDHKIIHGYTGNDYFNTLSCSGKLIKKIKIQTQLVPITKDYIEKTRQTSISAELNSSTPSHSYIKAFKSKFFDESFPEYHPLFKNIVVDSDGNILVFLYVADSDIKEIPFHVYSPTGEFICKCSLIKKDLKFNIDNRMNNIVFSEHGLFCFVGVPDPEDEEEQQERLIKVKLQ